MRWSREYIDQTSFTKQVLTVDKSDVVVLQKAVLPYVKKLRAKYEKYRDIHDSGDATEKQEDILIEVNVELERLEAFLKQ